MKFADDLLALYKKHFSKEDHLPIFVYSILEQLDHEDLIHILQDCKKEELQDLVASSVLEYIDTNKKKTLTPTPFQPIEQKRKKIH
ncbi:DUF6154 family protein [Pontibacillus sp. HMF3514]|uniref:DUF6154 family protein n=1 Tax=Pontibacillus sp. HMF3514 TaxID=2692425 RepID=UPI00131F5111|nr:DUF6154 family protein [Pontibacillus sp. HMF3514]QHE53337.1 hypothetical protein GS400_15520 [Pontibacillus sp. HMF3514]